MRRFFGYIWCHPRVVVLALIGAAGSMGLNTLTPLVRQVVDNVVLQARQPLMPRIMLSFGIGAARLGFGSIRRFNGGRLGLDVQHQLRMDVYAALQRLDGVKQDALQTGRTGERILYVLRARVFAHLQRLSMDFCERQLGRRIMTRMTTDIEALSSFMQTGLAIAVVAVLSFAGVLIAMFVINAGLAWVVLSVLPALTVAFRIKSYAAHSQAGERVSIVNGDFQEKVSGIRITQAYGQQERTAGHFADLACDCRGWRMRAQRYAAACFPFVEFLSEVATALVLWAGAARVHHGTLSAGGLIAFLLYVTMFFSPIQQLSQVFDGSQRADRILVFDHGALVEDGTHDQLLAAGSRYAAMWHSFAEPEAVTAATRTQTRCA